ncbi:MAG: hypothetical protein K8T20_03880 [Planctomycetes bacterium]|nr:hypothetical protein [Planctomycetota bacterium]
MSEEPADAAPDATHRRSAEAGAALAVAKKRRRFAMLAPPAAILAILLIGEIVARISGAHAISRLTSGGERGWAPSAGTRDVDGASATVTANGTRGPEAAPGGLLLVGDETVFGAGLRDDETLGAALSREAGAPVTLAACEGYGAQQEVLWIQELAPRLKPRAVVVVFAFDDPRPFAATIFTSIRFHLQSFSALAASVFPGSRVETRAELSAYYDPDGVPWRLFQSSLRTLGQWSAREHIPVVLAIWSVMTKQDDGLAEYLEDVRGEAYRNGLSIRNLLDDLGDSGLEALKLPNGRPNAEAVKRAAKGIAAALRGDETPD